MAKTILERGMLKTWVEQRAMSVTTVVCSEPRLVRGPRCPPWTAVWQAPAFALLLLRYYDGATSAGGLEEAHHAVVAQVRAGTLPLPLSPSPSPSPSVSLGPAPSSEEEVLEVVDGVLRVPFWRPVRQDGTQEDG